MWNTVVVRTCSEGWSRDKTSWHVEKHRRPQHKNQRKEQNQNVVELDGLRGYWIPTMILIQLENKRDWRMNKRSWKKKQWGGSSKQMPKEPTGHFGSSWCKHWLKKRISSRTIRAWTNGFGNSVRGTNHSVTFDANAIDVDDGNIYNHFGMTGKMGLEATTDSPRWAGPKRHGFGCTYRKIGSSAEKNVRKNRKKHQSELLQRTPWTSVGMDNVRGDVSALLEAIGTLRKMNSSSELGIALDIALQRSMLSVIR